MKKIFMLCLIMFLFQTEKINTNFPNNLAECLLISAVSCYIILSIFNSSFFGISKLEYYLKYDNHSSRNNNDDNNFGYNYNIYR